MNNDGDASDDHGHGTAVAGAAPVSSNNSLGVAITSPAAGSKIDPA